MRNANKTEVQEFVSLINNAQVKELHEFIEKHNNQVDLAQLINTAEVLSMPVLPHLAKQQQYGCLKQIVAIKGVDFNKADSEGNTALHWAAWRANDLIMDVILENSHDLFTLLRSKNNQGRMPWEEASSDLYLSPIKPELAEKLKNTAVRLKHIAHHELAITQREFKAAIRDALNQDDFLFFRRYRNNLDVQQELLKWADAPVNDAGTETKNEDNAPLLLAKACLQLRLLNLSIEKSEISESYYLDKALKCLSLAPDTEDKNQYLAVLTAQKALDDNVDPVSVEDKYFYFLIQSAKNNIITRKLIEWQMLNYDLSTPVIWRWKDIKATADIFDSQYFKTLLTVLSTGTFNVANSLYGLTEPQNLESAIKQIMSVEIAGHGHFHIAMFDAFLQLLSNASIPADKTNQMIQLLLQATRLLTAKDYYFLNAGIIRLINLLSAIISRVNAEQDKKELANHLVKLCEYANRNKQPKLFVILCENAIASLTNMTGISEQDKTILINRMINFSSAKDEKQAASLILVLNTELTLLQESMNKAVADKDSAKVDELLKSLMDYEAKHILYSEHEVAIIRAAILKACESTCYQKNITEILKNIWKREPKIYSIQFINKLVDATASLNHYNASKDYNDLFVKWGKEDSDNKEIVQRKIKAQLSCRSTLTGCTAKHNEFLRNFFGRLSLGDPDHLALKANYYMTARIDPLTKQTTNHLLLNLTLLLARYRGGEVRRELYHAIKIYIMLSGDLTLIHDQYGLDEQQCFALKQQLREKMKQRATSGKYATLAQTYLNVADNFDVVPATISDPDAWLLENPWPTVEMAQHVSHGMAQAHGHLKGIFKQTVDAKWFADKKAVKVKSTLVEQPRAAHAVNTTTQITQALEVKSVQPVAAARYALPAEYLNPVNLSHMAGAFDGINALYIHTKIMLLLSANAKQLKSLGLELGVAVDALKRQSLAFIKKEMNKSTIAQGFANWCMAELSGVTQQISDVDAHLLQRAATAGLSSVLTLAMQQVLDVNDKWIQVKAQEVVKFESLSESNMDTASIARQPVTLTPPSAPLLEFNLATVVEQQKEPVWAIPIAMQLTPATVVDVKKEAPIAPPLYPSVASPHPAEIIDKEIRSRVVTPIIDLDLLTSSDSTASVLPAATVVNDHPETTPPSKKDKQHDFYTTAPRSISSGTSIVKKPNETMSVTVTM